MSSKGAQIPVALQIQAVLLHTHVTHTQTIRHVPDSQSLTPLEKVHNRKPLTAADLGDKTLHEGQPVLIGRSIQIFLGFPSKNLRKMRCHKRHGRMPRPTEILGLPSGASC
jgi:hypothetical protein